MDTGRTRKGKDGTKTREGRLPSGAQYSVTKSEGMTRSSASKSSQTPTGERVSIVSRGRTSGVPTKKAWQTKSIAKEGGGVRASVRKEGYRDEGAGRYESSISRSMPRGEKTKARVKTAKSDKITRTRSRGGFGYTGETKKVTENGKTVHHTSEVSANRGNTSRYSHTDKVQGVREKQTRRKGKGYESVKMEQRGTGPGTRNKISKQTTFVGSSFSDGKSRSTERDGRTVSRTGDSGVKVKKRAKTVKK